MTLPTEFHRPKPVSTRLVTKTSFPDPKRAIALMLLMWHSAGKPASLHYGVTEGSGIILDDAQIDDLYEFSSSSASNLDRDILKEWVSENPLLTAQLESLNAAFELIWHLGSFSFEDEGMSRGAERTGGERHPKVIQFSSNMDVIDACFERDIAEYTTVLLNWLSSGELPSETAMESSLKKLLTAFSEVSFYKTCKGDDGIVYTPHNVYECFKQGDEQVELNVSGKEKQGPTRIFASLVKDGINPYLVRAGQRVAKAPSVSVQEIQDYASRAETTLKLSPLEVSVRSALAQGSERPNRSDLPYNLIVFGAPGTGKSHDLNLEVREFFPDKEQRTRVTFHPEYTYTQFVGTYKPWVVEDDDPSKSAADKVRNSKITYHYELGPFLETYVKAMLHPSVDYVLIIEELNRANPAAVFGDVFQLLDRGEKGESKYPIDTPLDMRDELWKRLYESEFLPKDDTLKTFSRETAKSASNTLSIPPNMHLWATMNSADQGVFPMDTAFKRRWDFKYKGINHGYEVIRDFEVPLGSDGHLVNWDELRRNINDLLLEDCKVNEDKLLGPFFIPPESLGDPEAFQSAFKDKVLLYLCEDAAKMKRAKLFKGCEKATITYAYICGEFDSKGEGIFGLSLGKDR